MSLFKKGIDLHSRSKLGKKDCKVLIARIHNTFPSSHKKDLENAIQEVEICNIRNENFSKLYFSNNEPILLELDQHLTPLLYLLWKVPTLLPTVLVRDPVATFLFNGADLMLPGCLPPPANDFTSFQQHHLYSVCLESLPTFPISVVQALLPPATLLGRVGRGFSNLHTLHDSLWQQGTKYIPASLSSFLSTLSAASPATSQPTTSFPSLSLTSSKAPVAPPLPTPSYPSTVPSTKPKTLLREISDDEFDAFDDFPSLGTSKPKKKTSYTPSHPIQPSPSPPQGQSSTPPPSTQVKGPQAKLNEVLPLECTKEEDNKDSEAAEKGQFDPGSITGICMDKLLEYALLECLAQNPSLESSLPIPIASLWNRMRQVCAVASCHPQLRLFWHQQGITCLPTKWDSSVVQLDLKRSQHSKMYQFFQSLQPLVAMKANKQNMNESSIVSINRKAPIFRGYVMVQKKDMHVLPEKYRLTSGGTASRPSICHLDGYLPTSSVRSLVQRFPIKEYLDPKHKDVLSMTQLKEMIQHLLSTDVKSSSSEVNLNENYLITDPALRSILLTHKELQQQKYFFPKKELFERWAKHFTTCQCIVKKDQEGKWESLTPWAKNQKLQILVLELLNKGNKITLLCLCESVGLDIDDLRGRFSDHLASGVSVLDKEAATVMSRGRSKNERVLFIQGHLGGKVIDYMMDSMYLNRDLILAELLSKKK